MKSTSLLRILSAAFVLSTASHLSAQVLANQVVNVDFNIGGSVTFYDNFGGSPQSPVTGTGSYWNGRSITGSNQFAPGSYTNNSTLLASDGTTSTSVSFSLTFSGSYNEMRFPSNPDYTTSLLEDFAYSGSGSANSLTISGLAANTSYSLFVYAMNARYGSNVTNFSVTGTYANSGSPLSSTVTNAGDNTTFTNGVNYTSFTGANLLKSDSSGNLVVNWTGVGGEGAFNGFQIYSVPEPSTWILAGCAIAGLALFRRFRSA